MSLRTMGFIPPVLFLLILTVVAATPAFAAPEVVWNRTFGGPMADYGTAVTVVDGDYVLAGITQRSADEIEAQLIRTDRDGNLIWNKTYGGAGNHQVFTVIAVDGGYLLAGCAQSCGNGDLDVYLIKTDLEGDLLWNKTYGGKGDEVGRSVIRVSDGYVIAGETNSLGQGGSDAYVIRTDLDGDMLWNKTYGGAGSDYGAVIVAVDGGYVLAGSTILSDSSDPDILLLRMDSEGDVLWSKTYDGAGYVEVKALAVADDGYVIAGPGIDLLKIDTSGNQLWRKRYGGSDFPDWVNTMIAVGDGYVIAGERIPVITSGMRVMPFDYDVSLIKADLNGNVLWSGEYDGGGKDEARSLAVADDGYVVAGNTQRSGNGYSDVYLMEVSFDNSSSAVVLNTGELVGTNVSTPQLPSGSSQNQTPPAGTTASRPSLSTAPSQTPGFGSMIMAIAVVIVSLVMLRRGDRL